MTQPCNTVRLYIDSDQALLETGADPDYGTPNALQCVEMFKQEDKWRGKFESASGRGKAAEAPSSAAAA